MEEFQTITERIDGDRVYVYVRGITHPMLVRLFAGEGMYVKRNYAFPGVQRKYPNFPSVIVTRTEKDAEIVVERCKDWLQQSKEINEEVEND